MSAYNISGQLRLMFDINPAKRSFYRACSCIYSRSHTLNKIIQLYLQESYCLLLLTFASPALPLSSIQVRELNACCNSVYRTLFGFNMWESVRCFINDLGRLNLIYIFNVRTLNFICIKFVLEVGFIFFLKFGFTALIILVPMIA
jgi:hypothetical protein